MSHVFLPDSLIKKWVQHTNNYAAANVPPNCYKEMKDYKILQFIAIYYYMGLVKLLAKKDD